VCVPPFEVSSTTVSPPSLSVIVPVHNGEQYLEHSLAALRDSELPRAQWELIVVDDSSQDRSVELATPYADRLVRIANGPLGPGVARNRGAAIARGAILTFVDADVCVHRDALRLILETFDHDPSVSAVFGAYDSRPSAPSLVSQYRNLLHRYVHERDAGEAVTFWAGCGGVRAAVFSGCGGFDETEHSKSSIEDIQLGYRMSSSGYRIRLQPEIQGTHLKRWTLGNMIRTDLFGRGLPWVRLLLRGNIRPAATLNLRPSEQMCTVLVALGLFALVIWVVSGDVTALAVAIATVLAMLAVNAPLLAWFGRQRGWWFVVQVIPLRVLYYALNAIAVIVGLLAFAREQQRRPSPDDKSSAPTRGAPSKRAAGAG
jgi:GT2 family glycosyltransferase